MKIFFEKRGRRFFLRDQNGQRVGAKKGYSAKAGASRAAERLARFNPDGAVIALAARPTMLTKLLRAVGKIPLATEIVALYFVMLDSDTPFPIRLSIATSLIYWLSPVDLLPGIPVDDILGISGALVLTAAHMKPEHIEKARQALRLRQ